MANDHHYTTTQTVDYLLTVGNVNFCISEYASAMARGTKETKIILKSGAELIADKDFEGFITYLHSQIKKHNAT